MSEFEEDSKEFAVRYVEEERMDTEQVFHSGDSVRFSGYLWHVKNFHGNRIYSVERATGGPLLHWEFAYEGELFKVEAEDLMSEQLRESIAQAKAKRQPGE